MIIITIGYVLPNNEHPFIQVIDIKPIKIPFYWINLDKCVERRANMEKLFSIHQIPNIRVSAILGHDEHTKSVGCYRSHLKAIKMIATGNDPIGIVCEDDLTMEYQQYWRKNLQDVLEEAPKGWDIIQLAVIIHPLIYRLFYSNYKKLYRPYHSYFFSTLCYAITKEGAIKITKDPQPYREPCEWAIYQHRQIKTYTYKYPMFTYPSNNDSTIHPSHLDSHEVSKNILTEYLKVNHYHL